MTPQESFRADLIESSPTSEVTMANYGYLHLTQEITSEELEDKLTDAVHAWFGNRMRVASTPFIDDGPVWFVCIPGSALPREESIKVGKSPDLFGFAVALQDHGRRVAFRHSVNSFERWCSGCIEELLSETFNVGIFYDATGQSHKPGVKRYRSQKSYQAYATQDFKKPLSEGDQKYIDSVLRPQAPIGWW